MGKQRDIQQRQRAIERNAQTNSPEMARLGAALAKKQVSRDHKKQRHADAGGGIEQIGDVPFHKGDGMRMSDIPTGTVDHHHHHAGDTAQVGDPVYLFLHQSLKVCWRNKV